MANIYLFLKSFTFEWMNNDEKRRSFEQFFYFTGINMRIIQPLWIGLDKYSHIKYSVV